MEQKKDILAVMSSSSDLLRCHGYGCVGRERELKELTDAWDQDKNRIFIIYGSKGTGKSCVMRTFLDKLIRRKAVDYRVIDIDFEDKKMNTGQFWKIIARKLKIEIESSTDEISGDILKEIEEMKIIFLLDNLDSTRNSGFFDDMQKTIIPELMQTSCVRVFISARVILHYAKKGDFLFPMEIKPLEIVDADNLLLETTKKAKQEICWGPFRPTIAKLSEGVPLAIVITGSHLMQYSGFITPERMVVLLIFGRMNTLSPDLYPKEDNMAQEYNDVIVKQSKCIRERLQNISNMEKTRFSLEELIQHLPVKADSLENAKPFFKRDSVRPLLDRCLVSFDGKSQFEIPGLLKELLIIQQAIGPSSGINDRLMCIRAIEQCLQQVGIEIETETLKDMIENPKRMEEIIQKIGKSLQRESDSKKESHEGSTREKFKKLAVVHPHEPLSSQGQEPKLLSSYEQTMQNIKKDDSQMYNSSSSKEKANMQMQTWQADQKQRSEKQPSCMLGQETKQHPYHMAGQNPEEQSYGASGQNSEQQQHRDGNFECNYCEGKLHRSELAGKADPMEKHNKLDPNCPHVQLYQEYWAQDNDEKEMARLQLGQSITGRGNAALTLVAGDKHFRCQYCQRLFHRTELDGNLDPMEKHKESCPDCLLVQVTNKEDGPVGEIVKNKTSWDDSLPVIDKTGQLEKDLISRGFQERGVEKTVGAQNKAEKFENKLNLSSVEEKPCPLKIKDSMRMEVEERQHSGDQFEDDQTSSNDEEHAMRYIQAMRLGDSQSAQLVHKREQDFEGDVYTLSWSFFPRVDVLMQQYKSIKERFEKLMDYYNTLMQNTEQQNQDLSTRVSLDALNKDPEILVFGGLRTKVTLKNIACCTDRPIDELPLKTISLRKRGEYYNPEDPCMVVFTARIDTENDILGCCDDLTCLLDGPYQHVLVVIEADPKINIQSEHSEDLNSIARCVEEHKKQGTKVQICILCDWLETQEVSQKISECFELRVVSLLSFIEVTLHKNIQQEDDSTARKLIYKELEKNLRIQEKLHFEVASLLKRTVAKDKFDYLLPPVELPSRDLFEIEEVEGFGTLYNKLHIHIKLKNHEDEEKVCERIKAKLFNYGYPYKIDVMVEKAELLFCVGETLHAVSDNKKLGYGTVGAFMKDLVGNLLILTCRHVVNLVCGHAERLCFIDTNNQIQIGTAIYVPPCNVEDVQTNFLDIAAVKVEVHLKARCNADFKRPDGATGPSNIFSRSFSDIAGRPVYKWGATTGMTKGIIASTDYQRRDSIPFPNLIVLIEPEPGAKGAFAKEGDSGATVCTLELDNTISVIAMVTAGRYTARDGTGETEAVFALHFREGINHLNRLLPNPINI